MTTGQLPPLPSPGELGPDQGPGPDDGTDPYQAFINRVADGQSSKTTTQPGIESQPDTMGRGPEQKTEWVPGERRYPEQHPFAAGRAAATAVTGTEAAPVGETEKSRSLRRKVAASATLAALVVGFGVWRGLAGNSEDSHANALAPVTATSTYSASSPSSSPTPNTSPSAEIPHYADYPTDYKVYPGLSDWGSNNVSREWGAGPDTAFSVDWNGTQFPISRMVAPTPDDVPSVNRLWNAVIHNLAAYMTIDPAQNPANYNRLVSMLTGNNPDTKTALEQQREAYAKLTPTMPPGSVLFLPWDDRDNNPVIPSFDFADDGSSVSMELSTGKLYVSRVAWSPTWIHDAYLAYSTSRAFYLGGFGFSCHAGPDGSAILDSLSFTMLDRVSQQEIK